MVAEQPRWDITDAPRPTEMATCIPGVPKAGVNGALGILICWGQP